MQTEDRGNGEIDDDENRLGEPTGILLPRTLFPVESVTLPGQLLSKYSPLAICSDDPQGSLGVSKEICGPAVAAVTAFFRFSSLMISVNGDVYVWTRGYDEQSSSLISGK